MQIWNADSEGLLDIYADKNLTVDYTHTGRMEGIENYKRFLQATYSSFPDMKVHINDIIANKKDESVTVFWNFTATHQNNRLFGVEPNGTPIKVSGMSFLKFKDKKVVHEQGIIDNLSLLMQLNPQS